jgi:hypothetical protein
MVQLYLHSRVRLHGVMLNLLSTGKSLPYRYNCKDVKWLVLAQNRVHWRVLWILRWMIRMPLKQIMCRSPKRFLRSSIGCTMESGLCRPYINCRARRDSNDNKDDFQQWNESVGKEGALAYHWNFLQETEENNDILIRISYAYCRESNYISLPSA